MKPIDSRIKVPVLERLAGEVRAAQSARNSAVFKMSEQLNNIHSQFLKSIIADREKMLNMMKPIALDTLKALRNRPNLYEEICRHTIHDSVREMQKLNKSILESMTSKSFAITELSNIFPVTSFASSFQRDVHFSALAGMRYVTEAINQINTVPNIFKELENSFSIRLFREIKTEDITFEDAVDSVREALAEKAETLSPSLISFEGMLSLLFGFIFFILAMVSSNESEERILAKMEQLEREVLGQIETWAPLEESSSYYIVKRPVNLRSKPTTKSSVITLLYPNLRVELIQRKGKWIYIRYFDYLEGVPRTGWAYKKYLTIER